LRPRTGRRARGRVNEHWGLAAGWLRFRRRWGGVACLRPVMRDSRVASVCPRRPTGRPTECRARLSPPTPRTKSLVSEQESREGRHAHPSGIRNFPAGSNLRAWNDAHHCRNGRQDYANDEATDEAYDAAHEQGFQQFPAPSPVMLAVGRFCPTEDPHDNADTHDIPEQIYGLHVSVKPLSSLRNYHIFHDRTLHHKIRPGREGRTERFLGISCR